MKKIIVILFVVIVICLLKNGEKGTVLIPKDAIRFRIIANSNNFSDQEMKLNIKQDLEPVISDILSNSNSIDETRKNIENSRPLFDDTIKKYNVDYNINYGFNYFPKKEFKGVTYPEGDYESLVITLGDGLGDNWWCVLFPPLCLIEANQDNIDDYSYSFYIKDVIQKFF